jgi:hypothetical protein
MADTYDLFRKDEKDNSIWVETVIGLNQLKKRLKKLSSLKPGNYLIYDPTEAKFVEPFMESPIRPSRPVILDGYSYSKNSQGSAG